MSDINSILDGTLDDLADLPEFKPFPVGSHRVVINWEMKEISKQTCPVMKMKAIETVELANSDDTPVSKDQSVDIAFMFKKKDGTRNEIGEGQFKEVMKSLAEHYGAKSNRELIAESNGAECIVTTKLRADKDDKDKLYTTIVAIGVV